MCTRLLTLLLAALSTAAHAGPVDDWHAAPDAKLVIVLVDGLSREFLHAQDLDGEALMPRTSDWAAEAVDFTDVLASETHPGRAREQLRVAIEAFGVSTVEWVRVGEADPVEAIESFAVGDRRQALVLDLDGLEPPLRFEDEALYRLDPAPWGDGKLEPPIESGEAGRRARARTLGEMRTRPNPRNPELVREFRWIVEAAHASIDGELATLLDAAAATGAAVLLTATSASGLGQRDAVGPGVGAGLDVARVPVLWLVPGQQPGQDSAPRQWIRLSPDWFASGNDDDRYTWAAPAIGQPDWAAICEVRWTTGSFTLVDTSSPPMPPRLYDRRLDEGEWYDRAVEYPALADSLRSVLLADLYGDSPAIVFRAGDEPVDLVLSVQGAGRRGSAESRVHLDPEETTRVQLPFVPSTVGLGALQSVRIGGEEFLLDKLVLHSPAWRALLREPEPGPGLTIWIE